MFQLTILKCASCNNNLTATNKNQIIVCKNCNTPNEIYKGETYPVRVTYVPSPGGEPQNQVYLPFWVVTTQIDIKSEEIKGGKIMRFLKGEHDLQGTQKIWVVAGDLDDAESEKLGYQYTKTQPGFSHGKTESIQEMPVIRDHNEATQIAEYLFLKYEVKRSGTLQYIDYSIEFSDRELVFLPFIRKRDAYSPLV